MIRPSTYFLFRALPILALAASVLPATAQEKNELGFTFGAAVTPDQSLRAPVPPDPAQFKFDSSLAFVVDYYRLLAKTRVLGVYGGVSLAVSPNDVITSQGPQAGPKQYAYLFLTPEVRVKLAPGSPIAPWVSFGGGWANFLEGRLRNGLRNPDSGSNGGAFQFGGGVDISTPFSVPFLKIPVGVRLAVRDYYASQPDYRIPVRGGLQNNVLFLGGLILKK